MYWYVIAAQKAEKRHSLSYLGNMYWYVTASPVKTQFGNSVTLTAARAIEWRWITKHAMLMSSLDFFGFCMMLGESWLSGGFLGIMHA